MKLLKSLLLATALITSSQAMDDNLPDYYQEKTSHMSINAPVIENNWPAFATYIVSGNLAGGFTRVFSSSLEQIERLGMANTTAVAANINLVRQQIYNDQLELLFSIYLSKNFPGNLNTAWFQPVSDFLYYRSCHPVVQSANDHPVVQEITQETSCLDSLLNWFC
jgi:hypothetical protein